MFDLVVTIVQAIEVEAQRAIAIAQNHVGKQIAFSGKCTGSPKQEQGNDRKVSYNSIHFLIMMT